MPTDAITTNLLRQLAAHRTTLHTLLAQRAGLGILYAPPGVHSGIAQARAAIAQLKADLQARGVAVDGEPGDVAGPEDALLSPPDPAAAQALLDRMPLDVVPDVAALPTPHRMPLPANPRFVGRADDLLAVAGALKPGGVAAITTGIGGVGKTQLASEFAHRYGQFFAGGVFWLSFADPQGVDTEIAACGGAGALGLYADADKLEIAEQIAKVYQAWEQPIPRLLIFDNCDDTEGKAAEDVLAAWLPRSGGCRVLVTSRSGQWRDPRVAAHALGTLSRPESVALLKGYRADLRDAAAGAIAELLGDLPLALSLAGSYLQTYAEDAIGKPATYLKNLERVLLEHRSLQGAGAAPSLTGHEQHVKATFEVSLKQLRPDVQVDALALAGLARAACLAPGEAFPRELLLATLGQETEDEDEIAQRADALRRLISLGLLERVEDGALRMHRLLSAFARAAVPDEGAQAAVERAVVNLGNAKVNDGYPSQLQPIIAHLRHAMAVADQRGDAEAAVLASALGSTELALTNYPAARVLFERALAIFEHSLGPLHRFTASSLVNLAGLLYSQGDYTAARPLFERALASFEESLGPQHPDTANALNNLGGLLENQGDYTAARPLYERALSIREQALGPLHHATTRTLNNLANLLSRQGDYAAARPLYERALSAREQELGPHHPDTARSLNNLANLLSAQGNYTEARQLFERALAIWEQTLGPLHPDTAKALNNLGALLHNQREYALARPLFERALTITEQTLGLLHPDTARALNNLGALLHSQGDYAAARPLFERALAIVEQVLDPFHPDTAQTLGNLANLLHDQGDYAAARPLFERALAIREQALGPTHPATLQTLNSLARLCESQDDYTVAHLLFERALAITEQSLGSHHPETIRALNKLAALHHSKGDYAAARPLFERALSAREQTLGPLHADTAQNLNDLASLLQGQGDHAAAQPLFERALAIREQVLGPQHPETASSLNNLAYLLQSQGERAAARPLYERALAICITQFGASHPATRTVRANLSALDTAQPTPQAVIAEITARAEAAVAQAKADSSIDRAALALHLEKLAQRSERGEAPGSPYLALAVSLRALKAQLGQGDE